MISLHVPLAENTKNLISENEFSIMKKGSILINVARGGIVDEHALAKALKKGVIAGAGIDVLQTEPPAKDNPLLKQFIPNLIVTPHIAWAAVESRQRLVDLIAQNIENFIKK